MIVTDKDKENIASKVKERKAQFKMSLDQVGNQVGANKSTVNKLVHDDEKWRTESVSEDMWVRFANWVNYDFHEESWKIHRGATNFKRYYNMCKHVSDASIMRIISDRFGKGKSTALKAYQFDHANRSWYFKCHKSWTQKVLVGQIKKALNLTGGVQNTFSTLEEIADHIMSIKHLKPAMFFDEYNRMPEGSKAQIFSLYEMTEGALGIILCGGENLKVELKRGVNNARQDCQEIYDRGGAKYLVSNPLLEKEMKSDITAICELNGITSPEVIQTLINNFTGSFREVKAGIDDYKRKLSKGGTNG
jgi:hypothetical protein